MSKKCSHDPVIFWVISEWARVRGLVLVKYFALLIQTQEAFSKEPPFFLVSKCLTSRIRINECVPSLFYGNRKQSSVLVMGASSGYHPGVIPVTEVVTAPLIPFAFFSPRIVVENSSPMTFSYYSTF